MRYLPQKVFILTLTLLSFTTINAQNKKVIDELKSKLLQQKSDTSKVNILNELAWQFTKIDRVKALAYAKEAEKISDSLAFTEGLVTSQVRIGTIAIHENDLEKAESIFLKVLATEKKENDLYGIGRAENQLGKIYYTKAQLQKAIDHYLLALEAFQADKNINASSSILNNIAVTYEKMGAYDTAMQYHIKGLSIRRKLKNPIKIAYSLSNMAALSIRLEDYSQAIDYLKESEKLLKENDHPYELSKVYTNLGISYFKKKEYPLSIEYYEKAVTINEKLGFINNNVDLYNKLAAIFYQLDDLDKAALYYNKNLAYQKEYEIENTLSETYCNLGNVAFKKEAYEEAIDYYEKGLLIAEKANDKNMLLNIKNNLSNSYLLISNKDKALELMYEYNDLKDSLYNASKSAILMNSNFHKEQMEIDLLAKDKLIAEEELMKEKIWKRGLLVLTFLLLLLFFAIFRGNKQKRKADLAIIEQQKVEKLLKNQELKSINAMMEGQESERQRIARDLHDRLGSILSMVKIHFKSVEDNIEELKNKNANIYEKANKLLDNACDEVRKISHDMASGVLTKFGLVAALEDLKETLEESKKVNVEFIAHGFENRLHGDVEITIYRIIQELISNILKHAQAKNITIQLIHKGHEMHVSVEDDGVGFDKNNMNQKTQGIGLKNIAARVDSIGGELYIDSSINNGTSITIDIPIKEI